MNYFRCCDNYSEEIEKYSITDRDLELFCEFLSQNDYFNKNQSTEYFFNNNREEVVEKWFKFLHVKMPRQEIPETYGSSIYRATFGATYTLEQLASTSLHFSPGANGSGLYAVVNDRFGTSYIKNHLRKQFQAFDNKKGNILKIDVKEGAKVMSKIDIHLARDRFAREISQMSINADIKKCIIDFLNSDSSITALLLGADMMYLPNGHVIVLNRDSLIFSKTQEKCEKYTLRVDLEKFRAMDKGEVQHVDEFLQPE